MNLKVFSVYDEKAGVFLQPIFLRTKGEAIRAMQDCLDDPKHQFNKHAGDFQLFQIGEYDSEKGSLWSPEVKENLGCLVELRAKLVNDK